MSGPTGEELRDQGLERIERSQHPLWLERAKKRVVDLAKVAAVFSADDIREVVTRDLGEPHHPNLWGALVRSCLFDGLMVRSGRYQPSRRPEAHARMIPSYLSLLEP